LFFNICNVLQRNAHLAKLIVCSLFSIVFKTTFHGKNTTDKIKLDPLLKQLSISTMLFVLLFGLANLI